MNRWCKALFCFALLSTSIGFGQDGSKSTNDPFAQAVQTLAVEGLSRKERVKKVHAFVRDSIREVKTTYG